MQSDSEHPIFTPLSKNSRNTVYKLRFANVLGIFFNPGALRENDENHGNPGANHRFPKPRGLEIPDSKNDLIALLSRKKGKDPHPQDKSQHDWTLLRTPGRFTTRPLPVHFTTKMSVVRPFSVLSKDEMGPESKTGRFLSKAEILGVGVSSPLSTLSQYVHCCAIASQGGLLIQRLT